MWGRERGLSKTGAMGLEQFRRARITEKRVKPSARESFASQLHLDPNSIATNAIESGTRHMPGSRVEYV